MNDAKVIIALDFDTAPAAIKFAQQFDPAKCRMKVGKELFTSVGPDVVKQLIDLGFDVFLDMKYHDIPNTVAKAVHAAAELGVWMVNVHASGGSRMMKAAVASLAGIPQERRPILIAVTVLTSMDEQDFTELGISLSPQEQVKRLALLAQSSGMDGVVCSAQETPVLSQLCGESFQLITPGIRPANAQADDQRRTMTPAEAIAAGSHYLVIGRPITQSSEPVRALENIRTELGLNTN